MEIILSITLSQLQLQVIILLISLSDVPFENGVLNVYSSFRLPSDSNIHVDSSNISFISFLFVASTHILEELKKYKSTSIVNSNYYPYSYPFSYPDSYTYTYYSDSNSDSNSDSKHNSKHNSCCIIV